ncbi:MAG: serine hydrolase [Flavobacteriaceae bacterium]|nr:serine hydrolase [Flavobacteriaceae bacterium]
MKRFLIWFFGIILLLLSILFITDTEYVLKGVRVVYMTGHTTAFIDDHIYFDNEVIPASSNPQPWPQHSEYNRAQLTDRLQQVNEELGTVALVIIKNDSIWFEEYAEGYGRESKTNSFSMAKSVTSALLGKAIQQGYIKSLEQPVGELISKFKGSSLTVGDLSSMSSGLNWDESYVNPFGMTARAYYDDDLAETILDLDVVTTPGESYRYLSGNTQLLAMVIEKATGQRLASYLEEQFWKPLGATQEAIWQIDDEKHRLVKAYCCIGSNALDFARLGKLYKDHGRWNGQQVLDSSFVARSIQPRFEESPEYGYGFWLSDHLGKEIFVMRGILGQYVITIPEDDIIIVRLGHQRGNYSEGRPFTDEFYTIIEEAYAMLDQNE